MPRIYTPRARAASTAQTRARIIRAARRLIPKSSDLAVDAIAAAAGVSVQTLYDQFGSKRGLLLAVIDTVQQDAGLYADFDVVWRSPDGETALRRMLEATIRIWHGAWSLVEFAERVRRTDPEIRTYLRQVDAYRRSNLVSIMDRLVIERRIRAELDATTAADLAFALSVPAVYEELVRVRGWTLERAMQSVTDSIVDSVIDATSPVVDDPAADWSAALRPAEALAQPPD
jgi:AcrR family transcriptional regulator